MSERQERRFPQRGIAATKSTRRLQANRMLVCETQTSERQGGAMQEFIARHHEEVAGTLSGFDRGVFRGSLRRIAYVEGMKYYLRENGVLLKDFSRHVNGVTEQMKKASLDEVQKAGRPHQYLPSPQVNKEEVARSIPRTGGATYRHP